MYPFSCLAARLCISSAKPNQRFGASLKKGYPKEDSAPPLPVAEEGRALSPQPHRLQTVVEQVRKR